MSSLKLKNQIIEWLEAQPYWLQFAGNQILEGCKIDKTLIVPTYIFFKENNGFKEIETETIPIEFNKITLAEAAISSNLSLREIKNIENVNALATGQSIEINENLTIVYGNNGSGKSGYIRLLNNAFNSRGDKNIFANVFSEAPAGGPPKCDFIFQSTDETYEKSYPADKNNYEFSQFAVFDSQSVKVHLDNDNQLNFTPSGFDFFEKILQLFEELKALLNADIAKYKPLNNFKIHFQNENKIKLFIQTLSAKSNDTVLKELADFTETDTSQLEEIRIKIAGLKALNIQEHISVFEKLQRELSDFTQQQQLVLNILTKENLDYYDGLIDSCINLQAVSSAVGIKSLEQYSIDLIGGQSWRNFIDAAKSYVDDIEETRWIEDLYPTEKDHCIFCLQPLSLKENTLINIYWQLLKSQAENELNKTKQITKSAITELKRLISVKFEESNSLYVYLDKLSPELTTKWKELVVASETVKDNIIKNLGNLNKELPLIPFTENTNEFEEVKVHIQREIDALLLKKPDQEIAVLTSQLNYLTDKSLLSKLLPQVIDLIASYKWAFLAESSLSVFSKTNSLTTFQGSLFNKHITSKYKESFNSECGFLKAPMFVEIVQQNSKLKTLRKLSIANKTASQILSEGEQRAISLADFLTEVQLNPNNRGVIFDDPVTSLDHQRRAIIAERLVNLSESKQVIIFTHDISFFVKLTHFAKAMEIPFTQTTIRRIGDSVGIIKPDLPWVAQKIKDRIGYLRNALVRLTKLEKEGNEDDYNMQIKGWYGMLREAWERSIEERLFKGAIERFSCEIHTKPLERIDITPALIAMINDGMTQSSNWVHDQAMGLNPPIPESSKAEKDLALLFEFSEKCKV